MHALAQRIAHLQHADDLVGKGLDHGNLEPEAEILHLGAERLAFVEQRSRSAPRAPAGTCSSAGGDFASPSISTDGAGCGQRIARQVDAVEIAKILAAILQMVVDLQAGAQRVGCRPGRRALAVHVEHEAADRHRRVAAIVNDVVPVLVAQLGHVHPERDQHVERVARRHPALGQRVAQADRFRLAVALAEQFRLEQVELGAAFRPPPASRDRRCRRRCGRNCRTPGSAPGDADE